jgi:hypothetical protein
MVPAPHRSNRAGQPGDGYAHEDRKPADVMYPARPSRPGSDDARAADMIGDEQPRADQTDTRPRDQNRNGAGAGAASIGALEPRGGATVEDAGEDEIDPLIPTVRTDRQRTDRVAPPVVAATRGADCGERNDEQRPGNDTAEVLSGTTTGHTWNSNPDGVGGAAATRVVTETGSNSVASAATAPITAPVAGPSGVAIWMFCPSSP